MYLHAMLVKLKKLHGQNEANIKYGQCSNTRPPKMCIVKVLWEAHCYNVKSRNRYALTKFFLTKLFKVGE